MYIIHIITSLGEIYFIKWLSNLHRWPVSKVRDSCFYTPVCQGPGRHWAQVCFKPEKLDVSFDNQQTLFTYSK